MDLNSDHLGLPYGVDISYDACDRDRDCYFLRMSQPSSLVRYHRYQRR